MKFRLFLLRTLVVPISGAGATPAKSQRKMSRRTVVGYLRLLPAQSIDKVVSSPKMFFD